LLRIAAVVRAAYSLSNLCTGASAPSCGASAKGRARSWCAAERRAARIRSTRSPVPEFDALGAPQSAVRPFAGICIPPEFDALALDAGGAVLVRMGREG